MARCRHFVYVKSSQIAGQTVLEDSLYGIKIQRFCRVAKTASSHPTTLPSLPATSPPCLTSNLYSRPRSMSSRPSPFCHLDQARGEIWLLGWLCLLPAWPGPACRFLDFALRAPLEMTGGRFARNEKRPLQPSRNLYALVDVQISRLRTSGFARNDKKVDVQIARLRLPSPLEMTEGTVA